MNKLYNIDCLEGMKKLPDNSVDMILCDLPYGVLKTRGNAHTKWDVVIPFDKLWEQYKRIAKPNAAIVLTAIQPFATDLINSNRKMFKYELIWCKSRASGFLNAKRKPISCHENILVFYDKPPIYLPQKYPVPEVHARKRNAKVKSQASSKAFAVSNTDYVYVDDGTRYPDTLLEFKSVYRKGMHPTEKPVDLFAYLIRSYTTPGAVVLDNCMGSGTTALAAIISGRKYIGYEKNEGYFKMANERIEELLKRGFDRTI